MGLSTAYAISMRWPDVRITLFEKEPDVSAHQSGRNSGVIHSGIYYTPGSLKAELCREGRKRLVEFCRSEGIQYDTCGKVIVAVTKDEVSGLERIYARGQANGVRCTMLSAEQLQRIEPSAVGLKAIHVPDAGIVDFVGVAKRLAAILGERHHLVRLNAEVTGLRPEKEGAVVRWGSESDSFDLVVNCAGLHSDRIARMAGVDPGMQIVPFRGVYYELRPEARRLCNHLIYPVPDPAYPFLGVHFTRMIDGRVEVGPNAVLATGREGYSLRSINLRDLWEASKYSGFRSMARAHWRKGITEIHRTVSKYAYLKAIKVLVPEVIADDLVPCRSGIRAQGLREDGSMVDDFVIIDQPGMIHVCNAPSPAATACLSIGDHIASRVGNRLFA